MAEDSALEAGLGGDEECGALGSEGVGLASSLARNCRPTRAFMMEEAAGGCSGGGGDLGDGHGAAVEDVEDAVADGCFEDQRWDVAPADLHDALGRNGRRIGHSRGVLFSRNAVWDCAVSVSVREEGEGDST